MFYYMHYILSMYETLQEAYLEVKGALSTESNVTK